MAKQMRALLDELDAHARASARIRRQLRQLGHRGGLRSTR